MKPTSVYLIRRERERTCTVVVEAPVDGEPRDLYADLERIGFMDDAKRGFAVPPPLNGIGERWFTKRGSALFGAWTEDEARENLRALRRTLAVYGFRDVPINELALADLL